MSEALQREYQRLFLKWVAGKANAREIRRFMVLEIMRGGVR